jgi:general secretion pathway protein K
MIPPADNQRGFALLAVTVALAVLALILGAVAMSSRGFVHDSADALEAIQLDAALDAGVATAARDLSGPDDAPQRYLRAPQTFQIGDIEVSVLARPEGSKVDLNTADPALLAGLLRASGIAPERASRLADEIADWRDADSEARLHGAEAGDYLAAGRKDAPANEPLQTVSEVALVLDGDSDLAVCLAPDVTVYARQKSVDLAGASDRVKRAVAFADPQAGLAAMPAIGNVAFLAPPTSLYELSVTAHDLAAGASRTRRVVMRVTGNAVRPFWLLSDASPAPDPQTAQAACGRFAARN